MTTLTLAALVAALADGPRAPSTPAIPYESPGACPFECCTYRSWSVQADTDLLVDRRDDATVAFRVRRGATVRALTGVVVTTRPGRAVVRRPSALGGVQVRPGDSIVVLHYVGEGFWKLWVRGHVVEDEVPDAESSCGFDTGVRVPCAVQILEEPETVWWVKIRSRGRDGWTRQVDHFGDVDACG
jgi:hypothetical protein